MTSSPAPIGIVKKIILEDGSLTLQVEPADGYTPDDLGRMVERAYRLLDLPEDEFLAAFSQS